MTSTVVKHDVKAVGKAFGILGDYLRSAPYGSGHINDTYAAVYDQGGAPMRYIHQRINHNIFKDPASLMNNIYRVTGHQLSKLGALDTSEQSRRALTVLAGPDGKPYWNDSAGNFWRTYIFIENARTYDIIESEAQAEAAARAFGEFQKTLADMGGARLVETIPNFHNTPWRFENLEKAIAADSHNRAKDCKTEIEKTLAKKHVTARLTQLLAAGELPERVTHNDTKLNNVMIDDTSGEGICVIDLDTVMPGLALYDFGDMIRTATMPVKEDELDLSKVVMQQNMFEALARGYVSSAAGFLTKTERENLAFSGQLMAFEVALRFLTDYLEGDVYFKIHRPGQNLDRHRTQFTLACEIEKNLDMMNKFIEGL